MGSLGAPELILILLILGMIFIFPVWGYNEGSKRSIGAVGGLLLGLFLGIFGIIIIYCTPKIDKQTFYNFNNSSSAADQLLKYKQLLDNGAITEAEYNIQKAKILNQ